MRRARRAATAAVSLAALLGGSLLAWVALRDRPQDLPWTRLDLDQPIGIFTGRKLAGLTGDAARCRSLLRAAGVRYVALASVIGDAPQCGYADGVRLVPGGARGIGFVPASPGMSCPVAAALSLWEWEIVQPAAQRHFGAAVVRIEHLGSYACRRMYGRGTGGWSEHATADAIDIAAFRLADGTRIGVAEDWEEGGAKAAFLREVRTGACRLFSTVLSPDYNAAHRDHLHLDEAERGEWGWRSCR
ncbi:MULTISPECIES: extensin family protein [unclassified Sphingomonas]|uniref:extensin-like domain-containing protein n=1 Tax=unclassified Sphingomonas TaxID=196159 RepID=UPI002458396D|nr:MULTISPECIES: extensin family protein [unclassified Sphingomonas]MDH4744097.1 extensin family protein [Sphingomonas sp. CBMAI 2297]